MYEQWVVDLLMELKRKVMENEKITWKELEDVIPHASQEVAGILRLSNNFIVSEDGITSLKLSNDFKTTEDGTICLADSPLYTFRIDNSVSNPSACITYADDAANMTQIQRKAWAYSMVEPTVVKNGEIAYKLNRANLAQREDGTSSNLTGADGDVCASFKPLWFKITKAGKVTTVSLSEVPRAGFVTAHKFAGLIKKYVHIGMFEATGECASVYSTTVTPTVSQTLKTFRTQAHTKNTGLPANLYNPMTYLTYTMFQALLIFAYGSLNTQSSVGQGLTGLSAASAVGNSALLTANGEYGDKAGSTSHVLALYVCNPWGNVWKFLDGCMERDRKFSLAVDQADIYDIESGWNGRPQEWHTFTTGLPQVTNGTWVYSTEFGGNAYAGFFPSSTAGGASNMYTCDCVGYNADGTDHCCLAGAAWVDAANAGAFFVYVGLGATYSYANVGARLQIMNLT